MANGEVREMKAPGIFVARSQLLCSGTRSQMFLSYSDIAELRSKWAQGRTGWRRRLGAHRGTLWPSWGQQQQMPVDYPELEIRPNLTSCSPGQRQPSLASLQQRAARIRGYHLICDLHFPCPCDNGDLLSSHCTPGFYLEDEQEEGRRSG